MPEYTHLFFDLDGTLWDFDGNTRESLRDLLELYSLDSLLSDFENFEHTYHLHNDRLWDLYRKGKIEKDKLRWYRFYLTLFDLGIKNEELARKMDRTYIEQTPLKTGLVPHSREILEYLSAKAYLMYIVTNGFNEVQFVKLKESGLQSFFIDMITSEMAGCQKPHPGFFSYALDSAGASPGRSLVIGDHPEADISGALSAGMDAVFFNPGGKEGNVVPTYEIKELRELRNIL